MPAMATVVTEFSDSANSRTYTVSGHTVAKPKLVLQKRKVGEIDGASSSDTVSIVYGTQDAAGAYLPARVVMEVTVRRPVDGIAADVTAALAVLRDIVASDEFTAVTTSQNYLK